MKARELDNLVEGFRQGITAGFASALNGWIQAVGDTPDRAAAEKPYLPPQNKKLISRIESLLAVAYVLGMDHGSSDIAAADEPPALSFKEAISAIKSRVSMTKAEWKALEPKLRFRAFTVARLSELGAIERVRRAVVSALEKGTPFEEFWTQADSMMTAGLSPTSPWYWETVFRTNVQTAYNTGRAAEFMRTQPEYLEFVGITDERQSAICYARSHPPVVLPASHPWWKNNWPPLHFDCRSTVRAVRKEEVDLMRQQDPDWQITQVSDLKSYTKPSRDFGANPLSTETFWKLTPQMVSRAQYLGVAGEIQAFAKSLGLDYDPIAVSGLKNESRSIVLKEIKAATEETKRKAISALKGLRSETIMNADLGEQVFVEKQGRKHAVSFSADPVKRAALNRLREIVEKAKIISAEPERKGGSYMEVIKGRVVIEVEGKAAQFELVLKRKVSDGSLIFYDLIPYKMK